MKHFAVHSGPEPERHTFDAVVSERDLRESYLPHFETGIREGGAYSLMCAYNRVDGKAACGSDMLIKDILRGEWKFPGYIVSDCGAIDDIYLRHKVVADRARGRRARREDGHGSRLRPSVSESRRGGEAGAHHRGADRYVGHATVSRALQARDVRRARRTCDGRRSRSACSTSRRTGSSRVEVGARVDRAAQERRDRRLPLRKDLGTIAVIGPNADQMANAARQLQRRSRPTRSRRCAAFARRCRTTTRVLYARGSDLADGFPVLDVVPPTRAARRRTASPGCAPSTSRASAMSGAPRFTATDSTLNADWREGAPRADMNVDDFGVRWTRHVPAAADRHVSARPHRHDEVPALPRRQPRRRARSIRRTTASSRIRDLAQSEPMQLEGGRRVSPARRGAGDVRRRAAPASLVAAARDARRPTR